MKPEKNVIDRMKRSTACFVTPFILFWVGLFFASLFDSILTSLVSLVPFYMYIFFAVNKSEQANYRNSLLSSCFFATLSLLILSFLLSIGVFYDYKFVEAVGHAAIVNTPFMMFFIFGGFFCVTLGIRWGCLWYDGWPDSK